MNAIKCKRCMWNQAVTVNDFVPGIDFKYPRPVCRECDDELQSLTPKKPVPCDADNLGGDFTSKTGVTEIDSPILSNLKGVVNMGGNIWVRKK